MDLDEKMKEILLEKLLEKAVSESDREREFDGNELERQVKLYKNEHEFKPGDKVMWKDKRLKNRKLPKMNEFGIVIEVLENPIYDEDNKNSGHPYFREPLDIRIAVLDSDNDLLIFYYDSNRFKKLEE